MFIRSYLWNRSSYRDADTTGAFSALELWGVDVILSGNNLLIT